MHTLIVLGIVAILAAKVVGIIFLVQWWKERSLRKEQEKAVNDFVDKMDERNRRR
jgi:hypothetical protein